MMYGRPEALDPVDQGDVIDSCPLVVLANYSSDTPDSAEVEVVPSRVIVLTQTCDFANRALSKAIVAVVLDAQTLVKSKVLKAADIRGPIRGGRVWGWYFLPHSHEYGLPESLVDLRQLHTVRLDVLTDLCRRGQRRVRMAPLYREHLGKHFGDTYSRIGLPDPYPTE